MSIETAVRTVVNTLKRDEAQGFSSGDRQFAIEILEKSLADVSGWAQRMRRSARTSKAADPIDIRKVQSDVEWAIRMFRESETPEVVDVPKLLKDVEAALKSLVAK